MKFLVNLWKWLEDWAYAIYETFHTTTPPEDKKESE